MRLLLLVLFLTPLDGGIVKPAPPSKVSRDFANAWGYNQLRIQLLEAERARIQVELTKLDVEKQAIVGEGKQKFSLDLSAGDAFDERTLDIKRK